MHKSRLPGVPEHSIVNSLKVTVSLSFGVRSTQLMEVLLPFLDKVRSN